MNNTDENIVRIDVDSVLKQRVPGIYRFLPRFLIAGLEKLICQKQLNQMLEYNRGKTDAEFCHGVMDYLNIKLNVVGSVPSDDRRVVIVSNHPLGGLDGIAMIDYFSTVYGGKVKFLVNDLLMAIKPLNGVFLPINKHGGQSRNSAVAIDEAFAGNDPIIIFPAGLVSRMQRSGVIQDLTWKKMFVNKAKEFNRNIIPVHFDGENSSFFYKFAKFRTRLGIKFNYEMMLLPRELVKTTNHQFTLKIGETIAWSSLRDGKDAETTALNIRNTVYAL
jgi:putative hemolysin